MVCTIQHEILNGFFVLCFNVNVFCFFLHCTMFCFYWLLIWFLNRVLEDLMMMITDGHHGWNHCWKKLSLFNARYMLILTRVNVICIVWIVWMVLSVLSVLLTTKTTVTFRFVFIVQSIHKFFFLLFVEKLIIWHILVHGLIIDLFFFWVDFS